jgi:hypothetical protein
MLVDEIFVVKDVDDEEDEIGRIVLLLPVVVAVVAFGVVVEVSLGVVVVVE